MLDERDPDRRAMLEAVVVWADQMRHQHAKDQAIRIINQLGASFKT
jgi:hypothetical protein